MMVRKRVFVTEHDGRERRRAGTRISVLAIAVLALAGLFGGPVSEALAGHGKTAPTIRSPRDGQRLPARPAMVKLYLGSARLVGAQLNGRSIADDLGRGHRAAPCVGTPVALTRGAVCKLRASPSHGLRYGTNVLKARFRRHGSARVRKVHFRVGHHRPLAAAGRDSFSVPHSRVRLNGRRSLMPSAKRQRHARFGKHASLDYRWRLVHAPRASHGRLSRAHTPTPTLKLGRHGAYRVRLTVTGPGGRTGADSVVVRSENQGAQGTDAAPLIGVDTMATVDRQQGVRLDVYSGSTGPPSCPKPLGLSCFYPDPGNGHEWVQLLVLNRQDLSVYANRAVYCDQATRAPKERDFDSSIAGLNCLVGLTNYIDGLHDDKLVIAVNQPGDGTNRQEQPPVGLGAALSGEVQVNGQPVGDIGIHATGWIDAVRNGGDPPPAARGTFSAIGVPGWKDGGVSNLSQDPGSWGTGRLQTNIAVNNQVRYAPFDPATNDETHSPLVKVLTQQPTAWPAATANQAAAFSAIGKRVGLTDDPRSYYYSAPTGENWGADLTAINALKPGDFPSLDPADFGWAQQRLSEEVFWITKVDTYTSALAEPYSDTQQTIWASFGKVIADVNNATSNGTSAKVWAGVKDVFEGMVDLIPGAGSAFKWSESAVFAAESLIGAYHAAVDIAELAGGEPADSGFQVDAANLGDTLTTRLNEAEKELRVRFFNIIVADYGKLRTVALCSTSSSGCDNSQNGWSFTKNRIANMETFLKMGFQRDLFTELVPAKYPLALGLTPVSQNHASDARDHAGKFFCGPFNPFTGSVGVYLWSTVERNYWRTRVSGEPPASWAFTPVVLTTGDPGFFGTWQEANWTVFGRMFDSIDPGGDFSKGGLGMDEAKFFADHYPSKYPKQADHFSYWPETSLGNHKCGWPWPDNT
jgi:hypothetical protein